MTKIIGDLDPLKRKSEIRNEIMEHLNTHLTTDLKYKIPASVMKEFLYLVSDWVFDDQIKLISRFMDTHPKFQKEPSLKDLGKSSFLDALDEIG